jgi:hypothetical protein
MLGNILSEHEQEIEVIFTNLKTNYGLTLPEKVAELEMIVQRAQKHPEDRVFLQYACLQLHRLKGTIGSYGFLELGKLIGEIEAKLQLLEPHTQDSNKIREYWHKFDPFVKEHFSEAKDLARMFSTMSKKGAY